MTKMGRKRNSEKEIGRNKKGIRRNRKKEEKKQTLLLLSMWFPFVSFIVLDYISYGYIWYTFVSVMSLERKKEQKRKKKKEGRTERKEKIKKHTRKNRREKDTKMAKAKDDERKKWRQVEHQHERHLSSVQRVVVHTIFDYDN